MTNIRIMKPKNNLFSKGPPLPERPSDISSSPASKSEGIAPLMLAPMVSPLPRNGPALGFDVKSFGAMTRKDLTVFMKLALCFAKYLLWTLNVTKMAMSSLMVAKYRV